MTSVCPVYGKKIAFVACGYPLDVSTMLINSIALLSEHNRLDIIVSPFDSRCTLCPDWMQALFVYVSRGSRGFVYRCLRKFCRIVARFLFPKSSIFAWRLKNFDLIMFSRWFGQHAENVRYDMVIAAECHALIAVAPAVTPSCELLYYNMELLDWSEEHPLYEDKIPLKKLEHRALNSVARVVITSHKRAHVFSEINNYPLENIFVLPVVPRKVAFTARTSFFRDMFAIAEDKVIVIYSGNFMPWAQCLEIIESMVAWPEEAVLVMHTWNEQALHSEYFRRMQATAQGRPVYFSSRYLPYSDLAHTLSSADVGLLYYEAIDANFTEIMFSSNKFGEYMAAGLPIICSPFPSLTEFVEKHNIGRAVSVENIGYALCDIIARLETHRTNVSKCRDAYFNFDRYFMETFSQGTVQRH